MINQNSENIWCKIFSVIYSLASRFYTAQMHEIFCYPIIWLSIIQIKIR